MYMYPHDKSVKFFKRNNFVAYNFDVIIMRRVLCIPSFVLTNVDCSIVVTKTAVTSVSAPPPIRESIVNRRCVLRKLSIHVKLANAFWTRIMTAVTDATVLWDSQVTSHIVEVSRPQSSQ